MDFVCNKSFVAFLGKTQSSGDSETIVKENLDVTQPLHSHAVGIMTTDDAQGHTVNRPLCVVLDTGSDETMLNYKALPSGANAKTMEGHCVTGVFGVVLMNQEFMLGGISFHECSPTQRVPGPLWATMFRNNDSQCDVIIGMDTMQVLGINVNCGTKMIS